MSILFGKCKNLVQISFEIGCNYTWKQNDKYFKWNHRKIKWIGISYEIYKKCIWITQKVCEWIHICEFCCNPIKKLK